MWHPNIVGRYPALGSRNFRYFLGGQCISLFGTWMQRTALLWLVFTETRSSFLVGMVGVAQFLPSLLLSLFAGVLIDRHDRRRILLWTQAVLMAQAVILSALAFAGVIEFWHIIVLSLVLGVANSADMPARQAFVIEMVGRKPLLNAIALNSTIFNLARIMGPMLAGFTMEMWGASTCFLLNAVSFVPVLWGLYKIDVRSKGGERRQGPVLQEIREGIAAILRNPIHVRTMGLLACVATFAMNSEVIVPAFVKNVIGASGREYSLLLSALGIGAFVGAVVLASRTRRAPDRRHLVLVAVGSSCSLMALFFSQEMVSGFILLGLVGFFNLVFLNFANTTIQLHSEDGMRGRIMSVYAVLVLGSTPVGNLVAGSVTERFGPRAGFFLCGLLTLVSSIAVLMRETAHHSEPPASGRAP